MKRELNKRFLSIIKDKYNNDQIYTFIKFLVNREWLKVDEDLIDSLESGVLDECFTKHRITIGITDFGYDDRLVVGIDPSEYYSTPSRCSIVANLPMSDKDMKDFYKKLYDVMFTKEKYTWITESISSWYGSYAIYGERK